MTNKNKKKLNIVSKNIKTTDKMIVYIRRRKKKVILEFRGIIDRIVMCIESS